MIVKTFLVLELHGMSGLSLSTYYVIRMAKRNNFTLPEKIRILDQTKSQPPQTLRTLSELTVPKPLSDDFLSRNKNYVKCFREKKRPEANAEREREVEKKVDESLNHWFKNYPS